MSTQAIEVDETGLLTRVSVKKETDTKLKIWFLQIDQV